MTNWILEGGLAMYGILAADLALVPLALVALALAITSRFSPAVSWPARIAGAVAVAGSAVPAVLGIAGWWRGRMQVDAALTAVDPAFLEQIRTVGYAEARTSLWFGGASSVVVLVPALLACVVAFLPRRAPDAD